MGESEGRPEPQPVGEGRAGPGAGLSAPPAARIDRWRYLRVVAFMTRAFLHVYLWDHWLRKVSPNGAPARTAERRWRAIARRYRALAVEMGGVLIKLGQFLSIRVDVLPRPITEELAGLQDEVPAEPLEAVVAIVEEDFGRPISETFPRFEPEPLGAASLAQVHGARLADGEPVVVKVQRPRIASLVETDLAAFAFGVRFLRLFAFVRRRVDLRRLYEEFARVTREELDFVNEAHNAERFGALFAEDPRIAVPEVHWAQTRPRVLTLEDVSGLKVTDVEALDAACISRAEMAAALAEVYLEQVFVHGFVHADPHPGNLFVRPRAGTAGGASTGDDADGGSTPVGRGAGEASGGSRPSSMPPPASPAPRETGEEESAEETEETEVGSAVESAPFEIVFIDFGMMAHVPERLRPELREYIIGFGTRDAARIVRASEAAGFLLPGADTRRIEQAVNTVFDRFWGVSMGDMQSQAMAEAEALAQQYRDLISELPIQFPADLLFIGRAVGMLSGLTTALDPSFDIWTATVPFARRMAMGEGDAKGVARWIEEGGRLLQPLLSLPLQAERVLSQAAIGSLRVEYAMAPDTARHAQRMEREAKRLRRAIVGSALLVSGVGLRAAEVLILDEGSGWSLLLIGGGVLMLIRSAMR